MHAHLFWNYKIWIRYTLCKAMLEKELASSVHMWLSISWTNLLTDENNAVNNSISKFSRERKYFRSFGEKFGHCHCGMINNNIELENTLDNKMIYLWQYLQWHSSVIYDVKLRALLSSIYNYRVWKIVI